jgi:predicted TIM-barrel fold metal-dependent hydrolase
MSAPNPHLLSRRQFHQVVATGLAALPVFPLVTNAAQPKDPGWIDAHVHVWTPDVKRYPLASGFSVAGMQPPSFTPEELFSHCRPCGVMRIVLIQMSFYQYDNSYMLDSMAAHPGTFSGVGIVDHHAADVAERMRQLAQRGVRGFRIHAHGEEASQWPTDDGMQRLWRTAREEKLAVCPLINPTDLPAVEALCKKFPETTVVIDHFARIGMSGTIDDGQLDQLCRLVRFPNVHVKVSAFYALGRKQAPYKDLLPMIHRLVDTFGSQRLMWASDSPFQVEKPHTYESSIALIRDHADFLSSSQKEDLLRNTAERLFFAPRS